MIVNLRERDSYYCVFDLRIWISHIQRDAGMPLRGYWFSFCWVMYAGRIWLYYVFTYVLTYMNRITSGLTFDLVVIVGNGITCQFRFEIVGFFFRRCPSHSFEHNFLIYIRLIWLRVDMWRIIYCLISLFLPLKFTHTPHILLEHFMGPDESVQRCDSTNLFCPNQREEKQKPVETLFNRLFSIQRNLRWELFGFTLPKQSIHSSHAHAIWTLIDWRVQWSAHCVTYEWGEIPEANSSNQFHLFWRRWHASRIELWFLRLEFIEEKGNLSFRS